VRVTDQVYDVIVLGGGLAGFAAARACATSGLATLVVERRPVLGWESTWAFELALEEGGSDAAAALVSAVKPAGGFCDGRLDAPILEMALDRELVASGADLLYYSQPVAAAEADGTIGAVVVAGKSGELGLRARAFVDATETALIWRLTGAERELARPQARFGVFVNGIREPTEYGPIGAMGGVENVTLVPSVWPGELAAYFEIPEPDPGLALLRLPGLLQALREERGELEGTVVTHVSVEPFPLAPLCRVVGAGGFRHPHVANLFGAGPWIGVAAEEGGVTARLALGETVGKELARSFDGLPRPPDTVPLPQSVQSPPEHSMKVLVCGGGTAGAIAAIAARREGARTTLLEAGTFLGGIGTGGGIHVYYHGVTGGLQDEVDERVRAVRSLFGPAVRVRGFHPIAKRVVLQQMAAEAGVEVVFNATVTGVQVEDVPTQLPATGKERVPRRIRGVVAAGPEGNATYRAEVIVDSTGDGDVAFMAGQSYTFGREKDALPHAYSQSCGKLDAHGKMIIINFDAGYCDPGDVEDLTRARREGLAHLWKDRFTASNRWTYIAPLIGLRSSRQIVGETRLTLADQVAGREFPDVIGYVRAHYDNHAYDYENESDEAMLWVWLLGNWKRPLGSEIPYRALLPRDVDGLIVACRALSVTHDAHIPVRMQRDMQRVGEAAGIAAALSARHNVLPREIPIAELQARLVESGALGPRRHPELPRPQEASRHVPHSLAPRFPARPIDEWVQELGGDDPRRAIWPIYCGGEEALPLLLKTAKEIDTDEGLWASVALAMLERGEAAPALIKCVRERRADLADGRKVAPMWQGAIVLLGRVRNAEALPALIEVLEDRQAPHAALVAAARALGQIGDPSAVPAIERMLARDDLPVDRALQVSYVRKEEQRARPAPEVAENARYELELAAAEALARLGAPRPEIVERYLHDPRAYVRRFARKVQATARTAPPA